jgi:glutathione S-transferase
MFIQELGIDLESVEVDLMAGENRQQDHLSRNPSGQMPTLELDNGEFISEITVICDYLDEVQGYTDLMGKTPETRAETRMWTRRIDLQIVEPLTNGFRFSEGHDFFKDRLRLIPQAADDLKTLAQERITWLDGQIEGKEFICGDRFSLADIMLYCFLNFGTTVGQPLNEDNKNVVNLYNKIHTRPSASA